MNHNGININFELPYSLYGIFIICSSAFWCWSIYFFSTMLTPYSVRPVKGRIFQFCGHEDETHDNGSNVQKCILTVNKHFVFFQKTLLNL